MKLFRLDLPPDRVHRLASELQLLVDRDITHPGIAAPLAADIVGVEAYLAQDFVAAESLDAVVRTHGPAPPAEAARIAMQLAGALDWAADAHVEHGALHPRDVLVSPDDARMTGFGITRALERIGGTPPIRRPYTAPERAASARWDRRADIFTLAALVHELLWGRRIAAIGAEAADGLTEIAGSDLGELQSVFARALAEDPADRYDTATEFAQALKDALLAAPAPVLEKSVGRPSRSGASADAEPRLPLDDDAPAEVNGDFDVATVFATEPASVRVEGVEPGIGFDTRERMLVPANRLAAPAFAFDSAETEMDADIAETVLERSRSAVWPLMLTLGIGIAVGFAMGYAVATRPGTALATRAEAPAPAVAATSGNVQRGVTETEVRLKPAPEVASRPPVSTEAAIAPSASRPGSVRGEPGPSPSAKPAVPSGSAVRPASVPVSTSGASAGRILIRSTPDGATAFLDGKEVGRTPVTLREVDRGAHNVRVARDGYTTAERRVSITAARPAQSVTIELTRARQAALVPTTPANLGRASASLSVESRPAGASVFFDGALVGKTPLTLSELAEGEHAMSIDLDGYRRWSRSVRVVVGERTRVTASLER